MTGRGEAPGRLSVWSWVLYDLANTIFALGVIGRYFPEWLISVGQPDSALALVEAGAGALVIFMAPWAGARSDVRGTRVPTLALTTIVCVASTALLASGPAGLSLALLGLALVAFNVGAVVYDALLVDVSTPANRGRISGLGVGVGYIGSFIGLGIGVVTLDVLGWSYSATFLVLALAFLVLALPAFFFIDERGGHDNAPLPALRDIGRKLVASWRLAGTYEGVVRFLVGRFLYTDAINTLIGGFLTIFVIEELGLDGRFTTRLLGVAIAAAIIGAFAAGSLVERFGPMKVLRAVPSPSLRRGVCGPLAGSMPFASFMACSRCRRASARWAEASSLRRMSPVARGTPQLALHVPERFQPGGDLVGGICWAMPSTCA